LNRENKKRKVDDSSFDEESIPEKETTTMNCGSCGRIMYIRKNTFGRYWCCNDKKNVNLQFILKRKIIY